MSIERIGWENYYKRAHIGYKLCSIALAIAIFCHIVMLSILSTMPQVFYLEFLKPVRSVEGRFNYLIVSADILSNSFSILASVLIITPYIVFSLGYVYVQVKRWYKFRKKPFLLWSQFNQWTNTASKHCLSTNKILLEVNVTHYIMGFIQWNQRFRIWNNLT